MCLTRLSSQMDYPGELSRLLLDDLTRASAKTDCCLYAQGGDVIRVHKAVLSISPHMLKILRESGSASCYCSSWEPSLVFPDIHHSVLKKVVLFFYTGKLIYPQDEDGSSLFKILTDIFGFSEGLLFAEPSENPYTMTCPITQCSKEIPIKEIWSHLKNELKREPDRHRKAASEHKKIVCLVCKMPINYLDRYPSLQKNIDNLKGHYESHFDPLKLYIYRNTGYKVDSTVDDVVRNHSGREQAAPISRKRSFPVEAKHRRRSASFASCSNDGPYEETAKDGKKLRPSKFSDNANKKRVCSECKRSISLNKMVHHLTQHKYQLLENEAKSMYKNERYECAHCNNGIFEVEKILITHLATKHSRLREILKEQHLTVNDFYDPQELEELNINDVVK